MATINLHRIVKATITHNNSNGAHWTTITVVNDEGQSDDITLFHDGTLTLEDTYDEDKKDTIAAS